MELLYPELHRLAARHLRAEQAGHTLQTTALIHEAFLRLVDADVSWTDRAHFFAVASLAMRQVLVNHARARRRLKRGAGAVALSLHEGLDQGVEADADVVDLDEALTRLAERDPRKAEALELHYFGGLNYGEIAEVLDVSAATVDRDLRFAKAWLYNDLRGQSGSG